MTEHLNIFVGLTDEAQNAEIMIEKEEDQKEKVLEMTIEEFLKLQAEAYENKKWRMDGLHLPKPTCKRQ